MRFIDFHVHIDYYKDYDIICSRYERKGIYTLFVTNLPQIYEKCIERYGKLKYVRVALGYNPQLSNEYSLNREMFLKNLNTTKYIGEVGLDFSKEYKNSFDSQIEDFNFICNQVYKTPKIMSIHSRRAEDKVLGIIEANNIKFAVFHWYSGPLKLIERILDNDYYFSVNPNMLRSNKGREIIKRIPIDRVLVETDGPFTTYNNKLMLPENIGYIYEELGNLYHIDNIQGVIYDNFRRLLTHHHELEEKIRK